MSFSPTWLDLREPVDHAARDDDLLIRAARCVEQGQVILDLGAGSGSTARAFGDRFSANAWRFLDSDAALLEIAAERHPGAEVICQDLGDVADLPFENVGLVTASALFDLMPLSWIEALADRLNAQNIPLYAALNYDGEMSWSPALDDDATITAHFNQHQLSDKGVGPALGPKAAQITQSLFEKCGYQVALKPSPWVLTSEHVELHDALLEGIADAAKQTGCRQADGWLTARRADLQATIGHIGHLDVLALPAGAF